MKLPRVVAVGSDLVSATMQLPINGIVIDNPSGGWLYVVEADDYCPPYTLQWSRDLQYRASAITVRYGKSPAGQISTRQGDPYTVTLDSEFVGNSSGVAQQFIENFTPVLTAVRANLTVGVLSGGIVPGFIAAVTNKRIRILTATASLDPADVSESPTIVSLDDSLGSGYSIPLVLNGRDQPSDKFVGIFDLPISAGLNINAGTDWANVIVNISVQYSLI